MPGHCAVAECPGSRLSLATPFRNSRRTESVSRPSCRPQGEAVACRGSLGLPAAGPSCAACSIRRDDMYQVQFYDTMYIDCYGRELPTTTYRNILPPPGDVYFLRKTITPGITQR